MVDRRTFIETTGAALVGSLVPGAVTEAFAEQQRPARSARPTPPAAPTTTKPAAPAAPEAQAPAPIPSVINVVGITVSDPEAKAAQDKHPGNNNRGGLSDFSQLEAKTVPVARVGTAAGAVGRVGVPGAGVVTDATGRMAGFQKMGSGFMQATGIGGLLNRGNGRGADWVVQEKLAQINDPTILIYGSAERANALKTFLAAQTGLPRNFTIAYVDAMAPDNSKFDDLFRDKGDVLVVAPTGAKIGTEPSGVAPDAMVVVLNGELSSILKGIAAAAPAAAPGASAPRPPGL